MKLSPALDSLVRAAQFRPGPAPAPPYIQDIFSKIEREATSRKLNRWLWLAVSTATVMTVSSPEAMASLFQHTTASSRLRERVAVAEFMREIGLRCLGINGLPRTINMLDAFRTSLPSAVVRLLDRTPWRFPSVPCLDSGQTAAVGRRLWEQVHHPTHTALEERLEAAHPDLPGLVVSNVYGGLFADQDRENRMGTTVGRVTLSLFAIACLRAQQRAGPQLLGHIHGLKNAWQDGSWTSDPHAGTEEGMRWLVSDEGCIWVLTKVDELVEALGEGQGSTLGPSTARSRI